MAIEYSKLSNSERRVAERFVYNGGNAIEAFSSAYSTKKLNNNQIKFRATELLNRDHVRKFIMDLRTNVSSSAAFDIQQLFNELVMVATANPAEIISWKVGCCRYCHGKNHAYQWKTEDEFSRSLADALDNNAKRLPDASGGFGYNHTASPHPGCPECAGEGIGRVNITPSDELSPSAARLYQGVELGPKGQLKVKLRNQDEAIKMIMRILGVYNPAAMINPPKLSNTDKPEEKVINGSQVPVDAIAAADFYQRFANGK